MEEELLIGWQEEKLHLNQEVCRLQEELAESRAEKDELESRNRALKDRVRRGRGVLLIIRVKPLHLSLSILPPAVAVVVSLTCSLSATRG